LCISGGAYTIDHDQRMHEVSGGAHVILPAIHRIGKAEIHASCSSAQQRVSDCPVVVVHNSQRRGYGRRLNVRRDRIGSVRESSHVGCIDIFRQMATLRGGECGIQNTRPRDERVGDQGVGLRVGQNGTQVALIGEKLQMIPRPDNRLTLYARIVARAGDVGRASSAGRSR
jgi:hypothetical protein